MQKRIMTCRFAAGLEDTHTLSGYLRQRPAIGVAGDENNEVGAFGWSNRSDPFLL